MQSPFTAAQNPTSPYAQWPKCSSHRHPTTLNFPNLHKVVSSLTVGHRKISASHVLAEVLPGCVPARAISQFEAYR
jgi:hypothetical protein